MPARLHVFRANYILMIILIGKWSESVAIHKNLNLQWPGECPWPEHSPGHFDQTPHNYMNWSNDCPIRSSRFPLRGILPIGFQNQQKEYVNRMREREHQMILMPASSASPGVNGFDFPDIFIKERKFTRLQPYIQKNGDWNFT